ncbi:MAG: hypothetical protein A3F13_07545 [Gammaproteobacteria bacterium RIFCSPHIGHO2_12_FULL_40_19]|nr:MAG: hypothetical protein A3F13_07545 [Gammaproteobacteria bacterium RIFCSPHIGHO2_12_FULL_40_19]
MKPFSGVLLVSDLDGTSLNKKFEISKQNRLAIENFVDEGGIFTIATGRMEISIRQYTDILSINSPVILYNGATIYDLNKRSVVWDNCLDENLALIFNDVIENYPDIAIEFFHRDGVYVVNTNPLIDVHEKKDGLSMIHCSLNQVPKPWYKIIFVGKHVELSVLQERIDLKISQSRTFFTEPQFLELLHLNASKGKALNKLKKICDIESYFTVSVGDGENDLELIQEADLGLCVNNAADILKKNARILKSSHNEDAIVEVLNIIKAMRFN